MKTKLNLICLLVVAVMIADMWGGWFEWNIGKNAANYESDIRKNGKSDLNQREVVDARMIQLLPVSEKQTAITVKNAVSGKDVNVWPMTLYVESDLYDSPGEWVNVLLLLVATIAILWALGAFIRFILRVNKNHFFDTTNVRLLRITGTALVLYASLASFWSIYDMVQDTRFFRLEGYSVDWLANIEYTPFILGLIAFVVAQVFAMAAKMQEEQELTI